jgi:branched-chain amino acid transport system ATP-binding protein
MSFLKLDGVESGSWRHAISLEVQAGEVLLVLGRNGVGKTTLLNTLAGLVPINRGTLVFQDEYITRLDAQDRVAKGIQIALEGRRIFRRLSVQKNLELGAFGRKQRDGVNDDIKWVTNVFPDLRVKLNHAAGTLSGGQQTQLNLARALMGRPKLLLLDEPALGLDPKNLNTVITTLKKIRAETGVTTLIAEQSGQFIEAFPNRVVVLVGGEILFDGLWQNVEHDKNILDVLR